MGGGRKNLLRAKQESHVTLQDGRSIMKVVSLRGSNLIENDVIFGIYATPIHQLIKLILRSGNHKLKLGIGNFVVVDESGKEKALESGSKVVCIVTQVLYHEQVRELQKSLQWPAIFKSGVADDSNKDLQESTFQLENERESSDDDSLPPLEVNTNRLRPFEVEEDSCYVRT